MVRPGREGQLEYSNGAWSVALLAHSGRSLKRRDIVSPSNGHLPIFYDCSQTFIYGGFNGEVLSDMLMGESGVCKAFSRGEEQCKAVTLDTK